ncbi:MAG: HAMP domain-containing protein [Candidatus Riflebacteria bacterium]|nr:HAMP domain-containing protein [Candidatus Riflebacteria bacterium]
MSGAATGRREARGWRVVGALVAVLPAVFLAALWNGFQELTWRSSEEEARRLLFPAAVRVREAAEPATVLQRIFLRAFPTGIPGFTAGAAPSLVSRLREGFAPFLHSLDHGFRLFVMAPRDPEKLPFQVCYPDPSPEAELVRQVWVGRDVDLDIRRGDSVPGMPEDLERGRAALTRLYGHQITLNEVARAAGFSFRLATRHASATHVCLDRSVFESRKFKTGVHLEIDEENLRAEAVWRLALEEAPAEVAYAAALPTGGGAVASVVRSPFAGIPSFPVPILEDEVEAFPQGFFLKTTGRDSRRHQVVVGIARPWYSVRPGPWVTVVQAGLLLLTLVAGWSVGGRLGRPEGLGWPLTWQLGAAFAFGGLVPGLILGYFGLTRLLETRTLWENHWRGAIRRVLQEGDRGVIHRVDRLQRDFGAWRSRLGRQPGLDLPEDPEVNAFRRVVLFFLDRQGVLRMNQLAQRQYAGKDNSVGRLVRVVLREFLQYLSEMREGSAPGTAPPAPPRVELGLEELLGERNLFQPFFLNHGRLVTADAFGEITTGFLDGVTALDGRLLGVMHAMFTNADLAWKFHAQYETDLPRDGVRRGSIMDFQILPLAFRDVPFLGELAERAYRSRTIEGTTGVIGSAPVLAEAMVSTFLPRHRLFGVVDQARLEESRRQDLWLIAGEIVLGLGSLLVAVLLVRRLFLQPVLLLDGGARALAAGRFEVRLPIPGADELGDLCRAFNGMAEGLEHRERMRRYVSAGVWQETGRDEPGAAVARRVEAAVLFADLRNFTGISEGRTPGQVIRMMNDYFTAMDGLIRRNGGQIDKFIGDAILAVFPVVEGEDDPCRRAVVAGLSMRARLSHLNRQRLRDGGFPLENGVGIHFGGLIEARIGSRTGRRDLTVLGKEVGRAMRLEAASKLATRSRVVVSAAVAERLGGEFPQWSLPGAGEDCFEVGLPWKGLDGGESGPA